MRYHEPVSPYPPKTLADDIYRCRLAWSYLSASLVDTFRPVVAAVARAVEDLPPLSPCALVGAPACDDALCRYCSGDAPLRYACLCDGGGSLPHAWNPTRCTNPNDPGFAE